MRVVPRFVVAFWMLSCGVGCDGDGGTTADGGAEEDSGSVEDAGRTDAGGRDAGRDAGRDLDAGHEPDAAGDASTVDAPSDTDAGEPVVAVRILGINDFHGWLEPPAGSAGRVELPDGTFVDAGGAAFLAAHIAARRDASPNTVVVSAGNLMGRSPLTSALLHDEPTIEVMNRIGLDVHAVGSHDLARGTAELLRMRSGGCHPIDGCVDGTPYAGAGFDFLAANVVVDPSTGRTLFPAHTIREVEGVRIAFIGVTLEATPAEIAPSAIAGLTFEDEVAAVNALVPELQAEGVEAIVVLLNEGGFTTGSFDECSEISGPIVDIATDLSPAVDVVLGGRTGEAYNCVIAGKIVTAAGSFGRLLTTVDLEIGARSGQVLAASAENTVVTRDVAPDPDVAAMIAEYAALVAPIARRQVGEIVTDLSRTPPPMGGGLSGLGAVIADAMLAATRSAALGGANVAFFHPGGMRADLVYARAPEEPVDGVVTYGEVAAVLPSRDRLVLMTLTGEQIRALLEQQFQETTTRILQVSRGFDFIYSRSAPIGSRVSAISIDGVPVNPSLEYRVTVPAFLAAGGDGFTVLTEGTDRVVGVEDREALVAYLQERSPVAAPGLDRITVIP